jgi:peroxiredoxin
LYAENSTASRRFQDWAIIALLALSLGLNVYLAAKIRLLPRTAPASLTAGAKAPRLNVEDLNGRKMALEWNEDSRPTILYIFAPTCVWCQKNHDNLKLLVRSQKQAYRIVGLSLTDASVNDYIERYKVEYDAVYVKPHTVDSRQPFQAVTPTTVLISRGGVIEDVWQGAYTGKVGKQIEEKFNIRLPNLAASSAAHD